MWRPIMNDKELLKEELRAVREELARRELALIHDYHSSLLYPKRDMKFARIHELPDNHLENHAERLERDLEDLKAGTEGLKNDVEE